MRFFIETFSILKDFFKLFASPGPDDCLKSDYYFGVEESPVSPRTLVEIENLLDVLQTEFCSRAKSVLVSEEPTAVTTQSPLDEEAFKSVKQDEAASTTPGDFGNFEETVKVENFEELNHHNHHHHHQNHYIHNQNGHATDSENKVG